MSHKESSDRAATEPLRGRRMSWSAGLPARTSFVQGGIFLVLAVASAWLLLRRDSMVESRHLATQARAQAELVAQAAGPSVSQEQSPRLLRILECIVRDGSIIAGAVVDSTGTILAHTNLSRTGARVELWNSTLGPAGPDSPALASKLFGETSGKFLVHPLLDGEGVNGIVALMLPERTFTEAARRLMLYILPSGLVLVAFLGVSQSTIRSALKPTSDSLGKLATAVGWKGDPTPESGVPVAKYNQVIQNTVSRIESLTGTNDELMLTNRLCSFENKRMKMILDHFPDGLIVMNLPNEVTFMNRSAIRTLGLNIDEERIRSPQQPPPELLRTIREVDKSGQALITAGTGGVERQILCSRVPLTAPGGKILGTLYAMRDMTAQNAAIRAQAEFLSQIAHELKAPLNTIVAYAEQLACDDKLELEERKGFYNTLNAEAGRMGQLIGNLLQLSRIQMGNLSASFNLVRLGSLIRDQVESFKIQAEDGGLTLDFDIPENLASIRGDKDLLAVAVTNLVSNALKYTPAGGKVVVRASEADEGVAIEVKDTGVGIPENIRSRIFERFFRSDQELVRQRPGSGLGLSLVKEIVELHNGRVTVESHVGSGSRFVIWLPTLEIGSRLNTAGALV